MTSLLENKSETNFSPNFALPQENKDRSHVVALGVSNFAVFHKRADNFVRVLLLLEAGCLLKDIVNLHNASFTICFMLSTSNMPSVLKIMN